MTKESENSKKFRLRRALYRLYTTNFYTLSKIRGETDFCSIKTAEKIGGAARRKEDWSLSLPAAPMQPTPLVKTPPEITKIRPWSLYVCFVWHFSAKYLASAFITLPKNQDKCWARLKKYQGTLKFWILTKCAPMD